MLYKHSQCNLNKAPTTNAMLPELVYAYKFEFKAKYCLAAQTLPEW